MSPSPLTIRTCPARWERKALFTGGGLALLGLGLFFSGGSDLTSTPGQIGLGVGALGTLMIVMRQLCILRSPAFIFNAKQRTVRVRQQGQGTKPVGDFDDFRGIELRARLRADVAAEALSGSVHETYPHASLMTYDVYLVGSGEAVKLIELTDKPRARELQQQIVRYCGFTFQGSVVPDAIRRLPQ